MAKKIIVDNRYAEVANIYWGSQFEILPSKTATNLATPVCAHPDMVLVQVGDLFVAEPSVFSYYQNLLPEERIVCGKTHLSANYPMDIAYNVLISPKGAIANKAHTDVFLKEQLNALKTPLISVKQGYAKCSAAVAGNCVITADRGVLNAAEELGLSALLISPGDVRLYGYDYGFIGGATGFIDGTLCFFGDITKHRDFEQIHSFLQQNDVPYTYIPDYPLTDVGTLIGI